MVAGTIKFRVYAHLLRTTFGVDFIAINAHGVFSAHIAHDLDANQLNYQPKEWCMADGD